MEELAKTEIPARSLFSSYFSISSLHVQLRLDFSENTSTYVRQPMELRDLLYPTSYGNIYPLETANWHVTHGQVQMC